MPKKYRIASTPNMCPYCETLIPTISVTEKQPSGHFQFDAVDLTKSDNVRGFFFHKKCIAKPEFSGWLAVFLKRNHKI